MFTSLTVFTTEVQQVVGRLAVKTLCDSWLEHIYQKKFKFREWTEGDKMEHCDSDIDQTPHWGNDRSNDYDIDVKMQTRARSMEPIAIDLESGGNARGPTLEEKWQLRCHV